MGSNTSFRILRLLISEAEFKPRSANPKPTLSTVYTGYFSTPRREKSIEAEGRNGKTAKLKSWVMSSLGLTGSGELTLAYQKFQTYNLGTKAIKIN